MGKLDTARVRVDPRGTRGYYICDSTGVWYLNAYSEWTAGVVTSSWWDTFEAAERFLKNQKNAQKAPDKEVVLKYALRVKAAIDEADEMYEALQVMLRLDENGKDFLIDIMYNNEWSEKKLKEFIDENYE